MFRGTIVLGAVVAALVIPSSVASAAPSDASNAAAARSVPKCVTWRLDSSGFKDHLWVTNQCRSTQRIKVIIAKGDDFSCISYRPGAQWHYEWSYPGRFDRLDRC